MIPFSIWVLGRENRPWPRGVMLQEMETFKLHFRKNLERERKGKKIVSAVFLFEHVEARGYFLEIIPLRFLIL